VHLKFEKFSGGYIPGSPLKGREERKDGRGKEGIRDTDGEKGSGMG
jgi:hypothetical protein